VFAPSMNLHSDFVAKLAECLLGCHRPVDGT
jgi:hypothetical protein